MKQVLQDLKTGAVTVVEVPEPGPARGRVLVRVQASLVSAGTESAQVAKARQSLLARVKAKPQLLRQGLEVLRDRGLAGLQEQIASKYEGLAELGYSCAGAVVDAGDDPALAPGTLVACGGAGIACHAEFVSVPLLLTAAAPEGLTPEAAAYTTVGAIAMQGVRQAGAQLGESVAVIGLGLVGLLTVQLLRANGCRVIGIDPSARACARGRTAGCEQAVEPEHALEAVLSLSGGYGADAIIICAATAESSPVELAGKLARSRGRVVMVGATGMSLPREDYYLKELSFTLSRSYGPGRYDRHYEEEGHDYPIDYVRFTEQRNMRAFLELVAARKIDPAQLTTHRFPAEQAPAAYTLLGDRTVDRVGVILEYPSSKPAPSQFTIQVAPARPIETGSVGVGFIGAGAYAQAVLLPLLKDKPGIALRSVMTRGGSHGLHSARRFGFEKVTSRIEDLLEDPAVNAVFITTRHDSHAALLARALRAGKHVWVEKPLALTLEQLREARQAMAENPSSRVVVGFNRPFSRSARWLLDALGTAQPRMMLYRVNAGFIPPESWVHDPAQGGGRLLGEGCHFLDFLRHVAGASAETVQVETPASDRADLPATGNFAATVRFSNGSVGQLLYSAQGAPGMPKEYFECFAGQACGSLHDYRAAEFFQGTRRTACARHAQDKGQAALLEAFLAGIRSGGPSPMRPEDILESSILTLAAQQSLLTRQPVQVNALRTQLL